MPSPLALFLLIVTVAEAYDSCVPASGPKLRIGQFNAKQLGKAKLSKPNVMDVIYKIMSRYDVLLMQEITDSTMEAPSVMQQQLNRLQESNPFQFVASDRLGRSRNKEQYVLWYRSGVKVLSTHQYSDPSDVFEREPFLVVVEIPRGRTLRKFGIMSIHVKPNDAVAELNALPAVYDYYREELNLEDILIAGDFNADCSYVSDKELSKLILRTDERFVWLIPDDADTNVAYSNCAYDRFVAAGKALVSGLDKCTAHTFKFDVEMGLSEEFARMVSDHYPIEVQILQKQKKEELR